MVSALDVDKYTDRAFFFLVCVCVCVCVKRVAVPFLPFFFPPGGLSYFCKLNYTWWRLDTAVILISR